MEQTAPGETHFLGAGADGCERMTCELVLTRLLMRFGSRKERDRVRVDLRRREDKGEEGPARLMGRQEVCGSSHRASKPQRPARSMPFLPQIPKLARKTRADCLNSHGTC